MEDWQDIASLVTGSFATAAFAALTGSVLLYAVLRAVHVIPQFKKNNTWRTDLRPASWLALALLPLVFLPSLGLGYLFSDMCGTSDITEVHSPDSKHKIVVYNFDCGATTAFSLDVSLLRADQKLPRHKTATLLYSHYRQFPASSGEQHNFEVSWSDATHVMVRIEGLDNSAKTKQQDGVTISFENLR